MRDVKFRGARADGKWVIGSLVRGIQDKKIYIFTLDDVAQWRVDPETVGQYIGINDGLNDKEWFEGDILTPNHHIQNTEIQIVCYDRYQAKFKGVPLSAYLINAGNGSWTGFDIKCWQKRIGNIHDNPELLEV